MNKKTLKRAILTFFSTVIILCIFALVYINFRRNKTESDLLRMADSIVSENVIIGNQCDCVEEVQFSVEKVEEDKNILGKLLIPKINVEAPVKDGTDAKILREAVGHFSNTKYWNGNICFASHNRGTYAHYFEKLNKLEKDDIIIFQTKLGTRKYYVESVEEIPETDVSVLNDREQNCVTLITCITGKKDKRLCVRAVEKYN